MDKSTAYQFLRKFIYDNSAIVLGENKDYLIESRLGALAKDEGFKSLEELLIQLQSSPLSDLGTRVVEAMTTNETSFFRDLSPFEALRDVVIPETIERNKQKRSLQIWCAASSSGQEPYSIALLLEVHFPQLKSWNVQIRATDISDQMLERVRSGIYSQLEVNRGLPVKLLVKYFDKTGPNSFQVKDSIRSRIKTEKLNLSKTFKFFPSLDIVFLRNVLIYFNKETKQQILKNVRENLDPLGTLFLGAAETTLNLDDKLYRRVIGKASCYTLNKEVP